MFDKKRSLTLKLHFLNGSTRLILFNVTFSPHKFRDQILHVLRVDVREKLLINLPVDVIHRNFYKKSKGNVLFSFRDYQIVGCFFIIR